MLPIECPYCQHSEASFQDESIAVIKTNGEVEFCDILFCAGCEQEFAAERRPK